METNLIPGYAADQEPDSASKNTPKRKLFSLFKPDANKPERTIRKSLRRLMEILDEDHLEMVNFIKNPGRTHEQLRSLLEMLIFMAEIRSKIIRLLAETDLTPPTVQIFLRELAEKISLLLQKEPADHFPARKEFVHILNSIIAAEEQINSGLQKNGISESRRIVIRADLIYQMYYSLFPAERMLVISGRRFDDLVILGAMFDVTGEAHASHVSSNPELLSRALIAMSNSDTYLAAWIHSHPGSGPGATLPSSIDLKQHQDWIRDYSSFLLNAIMTSDRYIRFWGSALENNKVSLMLDSVGLEKDHDNEHVYRLSQ